MGMLMILMAVPAAVRCEDQTQATNSLVMALGKEKVYPGESVPVTVTLTIHADSVRNIQFPKFATSQLIVSEISQLDQQQTEQVIRYRFGGTLWSGKPGKFTIGPATLSCEIMESAKGSSAFFGGQEPRLQKLVSGPATLEVIPLPAKGKPASFSGAIGKFSMSVKTVPSQVAIGEPITITTTICGIGSLTDAVCPALAYPDIKSYPVQARRSSNQLSCEQVLIPQIVTNLPPVVWSYFDPEDGVYRVQSGAVESRVVARPAIPVTQAAQPAHSATDTEKPVSYLWIILAAMTTLILISLLVIRLRSLRKPAPEKTPIKPSCDLDRMLLAAEEAFSNGDVRLFYNIIHVIIQDSVERSYSLYSDKSSASPLRNFEIMALTMACDKVRYGRIMPDCNAMAADLEKLKQLLSCIP